MRVALYARVSTVDQTLQPQLDTLRAYARARKLEVVETYTDHGISGSRDSRPALNELMAKARRRAFDAVAVVKLDRLARSTRHLTALAGELEALGVDLIVTDQGIDTTTPSGRLLFNVLAAIGEFELDLVRERTQAGLEVARKAGKRFGRPPVTDRRRQERIKRLHRSGNSLRSIGRQVGVSASTVRRVLAGAGNARK